MEKLGKLLCRFWGKEFGGLDFQQGRKGKSRICTSFVVGFNSGARGYPENSEDFGRVEGKGGLVVCPSSSVGL